MNYRKQKNAEANKMFAERLTNACIDRYGGEFKQRQLARSIGVSDPSVHRFFKGEAMPAVDTAIKIGSELGVCVEWLYTGRGPMKPPSSDASLFELFSRIKRLPVDDQLELLSVISASLRDK